MQPAIYVCSKIAYIPLWKSLRAKGLPIISRWIDATDLNQSDPDDMTPFWKDVIRPDMAKATHLLAYLRKREKREVLKAGLVEIGMAMDRNLPITVVTDLPQNELLDIVGTFIHDADVHIFRDTDINNALQSALQSRFGFAL